VAGARRARPESRANVILVVFGTTGELIKLAPVLLRLDARRRRYLLATTGQQVQQIPGFLDQFGLRQPDLWLAAGPGASARNLTSRVSQVTAPGRVNATNARIAEGPGRPPCRSRDTMTTVLGSMIGWSVRPVAHIEGGLRAKTCGTPSRRSSIASSATALSRTTTRRVPGLPEPARWRGRRRVEHDPR
jgi:UDP-N-acetylglucosamine 2-epimerase